MLDLTGLPHFGVDEIETYQPKPTFVAALEGHEIMHVACHSDHSLAVTKDGLVWAWGNARVGKLGLTDLVGLPHDELEVYQPKPTIVAALTPKLSSPYKWPSRMHFATHSFQSYTCQLHLHVTFRTSSCYITLFK